ncbi:hypothetical protein GCM10027203_47900 [Nonomuraea fastidiosa]|jgi:hypothetical protein
MDEPPPDGWFTFGLWTAGSRTAGLWMAGLWMVGSRTAGPWTAGRRACDPFGGAVRAPLGPAQSVHRPAGPGAYGAFIRDVRRRAARGIGPAPDRGETQTGLVGDDIVIEAAAVRGYHFTHLTQLALDHLLGVRG